MSVVQEERNELKKRFGDKAVILIEDNLYSTSLLQPNPKNHRLFEVHPEAVERLNSTMQRHIDGNAQIFVTMIFKDEPREELIKRFWNGLLSTKEFQNLPEALRMLEHEQARKIGPTSRFTIEKLYDGFINHIDESAKTRNQHRAEWEEGFEPFCQYVADAILEARRRYPDEVEKYFVNFYKLQNAMDNLNKDKVGGDPFYIRVDRKIAGEIANKLYFKKVPDIQRDMNAQVYYEMFIRVQNKGNKIVPEKIEEVTKIPSNPWIDEKNRVVQGDSRSWQFLLKNMSDIITKVPKMVDPIFMGWADQDYKNEVMLNTMKEFRGKYLFDSFDATDYDASTDPWNFSTGIRILYHICELVGLDPSKIVQLEHVINHYLHDATLTPWGAFKRDSTPSGHNFTGPNGTLTNLYRVYVQTKRLFKCNFQELNYKLKGYREKRIALFGAVGDDAFQLREKNVTPDSIAEENNSDGFKSSDSGKIVLSESYIHFLQFAYYLDDHDSYMGYYPISRVIEHALFQEKADQYSAETVVAQAVVQNLNNARFNPLQGYGIDFLMEGDRKYRLGSKMGVINLFKLAAAGRSVAETVGREWDPSYQGMTWEQFGETIRETAKAIESRAGKYS